MMLSNWLLILCLLSSSFLSIRPLNVLDLLIPWPRLFIYPSLGALNHPHGLKCHLVADDSPGHIPNVNSRFTYPYSWISNMYLKLNVSMHERLMYCSHIKRKKKSYHLPADLPVYALVPAQFIFRTAKRIFLNHKSVPVTLLFKLFSGLTTSRCQGLKDEEALCDDVTNPWHSSSIRKHADMWSGFQCLWRSGGGKGGATYWPL